MPNKPARPCKQPGCPNLTTSRRGYCPDHSPANYRYEERNRPSPTKRGYDARWRRASRFYLARHPLCALCLKKEPSVVRAATLVDHIIPHRGDERLFWDESNWQSLCDECHNIKTAKEDGAFGRK